MMSEFESSKHDDKIDKSYHTISQVQDVEQDEDEDPDQELEPEGEPAHFYEEEEEYDN